VLPRSFAPGSLDSAALCSGRRAPISHCCRLIAALQDCIMQIGLMRFACIERDDYAFMLQIGFLRPSPRGTFFSTGRSLHTHSLQSSPSVAISIVSKMVWSARSEKNGSAGSGSVGRAGSMALYLSNVLSLRSGRFTEVARASLLALSFIDVSQGLVLLCHIARHRFENSPDVFGKDLLAGCVWMNAVAQIK